MNTMLITWTILFALITMGTSSAPIYEEDEYVSCVCLEDDVTVIEYARAFNSLQGATKRFAQHMTDTRFDDYNHYNISQDSGIRHQEFKNYYSTVNESIYIMNDALTQLNTDLDTLAEDYYDWMLVIAGYVIKREFNSISDALNFGF